MDNILDYDIVVSEFEIQSRYNVHFQTNTLGKMNEPIIPTSYRLHITNIALL